MMTTRDVLLWQYDMAWRLMSHHLETLTTEECLWRPAEGGLHVHRNAGGEWTADWPEHERYDLGPASIAWLTWHACFWYSMLLDHTDGSATLQRDRVRWPGSAELLRTTLRQLHERWRSVMEHTPPGDWGATARTRWPFGDRPFADLVAWSTVELTKSASEIGYARFLYAGRHR